MVDYKILEINDDNIDSLQPLNEEAFRDGDTFMKRTIDEWKLGKNTFSKPHEKFWGFFDGTVCIATGGLNIDPYVLDNDGTVGRVRHVYVLKEYRGQGLSKILMKLIIDEAKKHFTMLRLSTHNPIAVSLYESMGFLKTEGHKVTHMLHL